MPILRNTVEGSFDPNVLRKTILEMAYSGHTVHIGCAFSIVEILSVLHYHFLNYPDNNPHSDLRDYLVLSKGHGVMAQYACMRERDWIDDDDTGSYFSNGTHLMGLSDARVPGLEVTSGSLGHGLSVGLGLAMAAKLNGTNQRMFAVIGDGETNEGPIWEAALFAAHHQLDNAVVIIDNNGFQAMGSTDEIMKTDHMKERFECFGFDAISVQGHETLELERALKTMIEKNNGKPKAIIANTTKGKGVSFMEGNNEWHYLRLDDALYAAALSELNT